jgi:hypothetical protein
MVVVLLLVLLLLLWHLRLLFSRPLGRNSIVG